MTSHSHEVPHLLLLPHQVLQRLNLPLLLTHMCLQASSHIRQASGLPMPMITSMDALPPDV